jgi:hypothetical protein
MGVDKKENYFTWDDAWAFTSLYYSHKDNDSINLPKIISIGEALNHAILTNIELKTAFIKLQRKGIIEIQNGLIKFTHIGKSIIESSEKVKGGLFSRVDISFKKLNSSSVKLPIIEEIDGCAFITVENIDDNT